MIASVGPSLSSLLQGLKLSSSSSKDINDIKKDLEEVENMRERIDAVLADAEKMQIRDKSIRLWLRDLRDLVDKVQYLLDLYEYEVVAREVQDDIEGASSSNDAAIATPKELRPSIISSLSPLEDPSFGQKIAGEVRGIREEFDRIAKRKDDLHLKETYGRMPSFDDSFIDRQSPGCLPTDPELVGREGQLEGLRNMLLADNHQNVEVIAVIGMGGVGKTALAQHVYKDSEVTAHFAIKGWVHVSQNFDPIRLMKATIESFTRKECLDNELSPPQDEVAELVEGKKVLLVMDGLWDDDVEKWDTFIAPIIRGAQKGSKILITTRLRDVARKASAGDDFIQLDRLSADDGWTLLRKHAIGKDDAETELEDIGKGIVKKCGGLPLAIKVLGCLLRSKGCDEDSWRDVLECNLLDFDEVQEGTQILGPIYLSYLHLSPKLKSCLKCCCIYPRGQIDGWGLKTVWMAFDIVKDEEEAQKCLQELESRSFFKVEFQEIEEKSMMRVRVRVRAHDLIYDLVRYLSGQEDEDEDEVKWHTSLHTLFINSSSDINLKPDSEIRLRMLDVRSARYYSGDYESFDGSECTLRILRMSGCPEPPRWIFRLHNLRYLYLEEGLAEEFPDDVGNLRKLRGILIKDFDIGILPESISKLVELQYLDLDSCLDLRVLPQGITNLRNLQRINIHRCGIRILPESISRLVNLQYLDIVYCLDLEELPEGITDLRNLRRMNLSLCGIRILPESISKLVNLQDLDLRCCDYLKELPQGITNLTNLRSLNLDETKIRYMPKGFGRLTKLEHLSDFYVGFSDEQAGLAELKNLVNLQGTLHLRQLCHVASVEDAMEAEMANKKLLLILNLHWNCDADDHNDQEELFIPDVQEGIFRHLRPHDNIEELNIRRYQGFKLPSWMGDGSFKKLVSIHIHGFRNCASLSPVDQLPSLKLLCISNMDSLADLFSEKCDGNNASDYASRNRAKTLIP